MKMKLTSIAASTAMLIAFSGAPLLAANDTNASPGVTKLLNQANQMNNEEQDMANMLHSKAGDNQALMTMADTIKGDHQANEDAVKALANQKNVTLNSYQKNTAMQDRLNNLNGANFNKAFLEDAIKDHRKAIDNFKNAKNDTTDRDVKVYIDETIPVLESHLRMAENMQRDDKMMGSPENPKDNSTNTSSNGSSHNPS